MELEKLQCLKNEGAKKIKELMSKGVDCEKEKEEQRDIKYAIKKVKQTVDKSAPGIGVCKNKSAVKIEFFDSNEPIEYQFSDCKVEVLYTLGANELKSIYQYEKENNVFPQNSIGWIAPWVEDNLGKDEFLVLKCLNESRIVIGLAFFQKKSILGFRYLETCPSHYGDFYNILVKKGYSAINVSEQILEHVNGLYGAVNFKGVNSTSPISTLLSDSEAIPYGRSNIYSVHISSDVKNGNLENILSKKHLSKLTSRYKKLKQNHDVELIYSSDLKEYSNVLSDIREIVCSRREEDLPDQKYKRRLRSLENIKWLDTYRLFVVKVDGVAVSYRIGFSYKNVFYEWKSGHHEEFSRYSLGDITTMELLKQLSEEGFAAHNFMAGDYDYKRKWSTKELTIENENYIYSKHVLARCMLAPIIKLILWLKK